MVGIKWPIQEHLVFFFDMLRRMGQALGKIAIVREKDQALALLVEPSDMKEPAKMPGNQVEDRRPASLIRTGTNDSLRLVKNDVDRRHSSGRPATGNPYIVARADNRCEISNKVAVDRHLSLFNQCLAGSPRPKARRRKKPV